MNIRPNNHPLKAKACAFLFIVFFASLLSAQDAKPEAARQVGTARKKLGVSVDTGLAAFSPNKDGIQDIQFFEIASTTAGVDGWAIAIIAVDTGGTVVFHKEGSGKIPKKLEWDGTVSTGSESGASDGTSASKNLAPDGRYRSEITVKKGINSVLILANEFILDTKPPSARIYAANGRTILTPGGDGVPMAVLVSQTDASQEKIWYGRIIADDGSVVRTAEWKGTPDAFAWDGRDSAGKSVPDGTYTYELSATDAAGNAFSARLRLRVDALLRTLALKASEAAFSPNGDGVKDAATLIPTLNKPDGLLSWQLEILGGTPGGEESVYAREGTVLPESIIWEGRTSSGEPAVNGTYLARMVLEFDNGQTCKALSPAFSLVTKLDPAAVSTDGDIFSPDGDKRKDTITLKNEFPRSPVSASWKSEIVDEKDGIIKSWDFSAGPKEILTWDGRAGTGKPAPTGSYRYRIRGLDQAGNTSVSRDASFVLDARKPTVSCTAETSPFSPNGDGKFDRKRFFLAASINEGVESWVLSIRAAGTDRNIAQIRGTELLPDEAIWDGMGSDGSALPKEAALPLEAVLPDGTYNATLAVLYRKGNESTSKAAAFSLDNLPPRLKISAAPQPFSPDGDGVNDRLDIILSARDNGTLASWQLDVIDPQGNAFMRFAGEGAAPEKIPWNGLNASGELIQADMDYKLSYSAADSGANAAQTSAKLRVDILVLREGDNWRIPLPGIAFPAESGDLDAVPEDIRKINSETLDRLAILLKKFKTYTILVEGHANSVRAAGGKIPDSAEQEEELIPLSALRALAVKNALIARGIAPERLESIGIGGARPMVDFGDKTELWKNRRVEFMLRK